jgi:putative ABC transport system permease protein
VSRLLLTKLRRDLVAARARAVLMASAWSCSARSCTCVPPWIGRSVSLATNRHGPATRSAVAAVAGRTLAGASFNVRSAELAEYFDTRLDRHVYVLAGVMLLLAAAMAVVGWLGLATTLSANVLDRTREFGVMRAIGAPVSVIRRVVVLEGVFLALASCAIALAAAVPSPSA